MESIGEGECYMRTSKVPSARGSAVQSAGGAFTQRKGSILRGNSHPRSDKVAEGNPEAFRGALTLLKLRQADLAQASSRAQHAYGVVTSLPGKQVRKCTALNRPATPHSKAESTNPSIRWTNQRSGSPISIELLREFQAGYCGLGLVSRGD